MDNYKLLLGDDYEGMPDRPQATVVVSNKKLLKKKIKKLELFMEVIRTLGAVCTILNLLLLLNLNLFGTKQNSFSVEDTHNDYPIQTSPSK